jgi:hypothetical protein
MYTSDCAVTCVAHIEAPCAMVARRYPGVAGRRPDAPACAPRGYGMRPARLRVSGQDAPAPVR